MLITVCTLQTRVHFLTSYCHMLRSCTFGSNCKQQEVNTPIYWFFVVYLGLKLKKKNLCIFVGLLLPVEVRSVHQLLNTNALWCVFMLSLLFSWPDSEEGLLKTSLTNKRQKVLEVTFLRTQMSLLLCVCTKDQILLLTNLFTAHLTLKHLCIHCQPSHFTAA